MRVHAALDRQVPAVASLDLAEVNDADAASSRRRSLKVDVLTLPEVK